MGLQRTEIRASRTLGSVAIAVAKRASVLSASSCASTLGALGAPGSAWTTHLPALPPVLKKSKPAGASPALSWSKDQVRDGATGAAEALAGGVVPAVTLGAGAVLPGAMGGVVTIGAGPPEVPPAGGVSRHPRATARSARVGSKSSARRVMAGIRARTRRGQKAEGRLLVEAGLQPTRSLRRACVRR